MQRPAESQTTGCRHYEPPEITGLIRQNVGNAGRWRDTLIVELLERGAALASLAGYADEARQGEGRLVLVAGEAGVGKSALVEQLA